MTRSAYGPAWDLDANRRRLEVTRGVTVASMWAQSNRDWTWLVALDRADPFRAERRAVFESAGVPVAFLDVESSGTRQVAAAEAYRADWDSLIGDRCQSVAMTRLDDDDAFAPWAMQRVADAATRIRVRSALMLPRGIRVWDGRCTLVRHNSNAMQTLVTPPGDTLHVYAYLHRKVATVAQVRHVDTRLAWVWSRHQDTISGHHTADVPLPPKIREMFPINWSVFGESTGGRVKVPMGGRYFR